MHASELRETAFRMWMEPGPEGEHRSFEDVAESLNIAKGTVVRWAKGNKKFGEEPWDARRKRVIALATEKSEEEIADEYKRVLEQLGTVRDDLFKCVQEMEPTSAEGAVHAMVSVIKLDQALRGPKKLDQAAMRQQILRDYIPRTVVAVCDFLSQDQAVKQSIESRKDALLEFVMGHMSSFAAEELRTLKP